MRYLRHVKLVGMTTYVDLAALLEALPPDSLLSLECGERLDHYIVYILSKCQRRLRRFVHSGPRKLDEMARLPGLDWTHVTLHREASDKEQVHLAKWSSKAPLVRALEIDRLNSPGRLAGEIEHGDLDSGYFSQFQPIRNTAHATAAGHHRSSSALFGLKCLTIRHANLCSSAAILPQSFDIQNLSSLILQDCSSLGPLLRTLAVGPTLRLNTLVLLSSLDHGAPDEKLNPFWPTLESLMLSFQGLETLIAGVSRYEEQGHRAMLQLENQCGGVFIAATHHAATLKVLMIDSGWWQFRPEDLEPLCTQCLKIEELGLEMPYYDVRARIDPWWKDLPYESIRDKGILEPYLKYIHQLPKLHTLRLIRCPMSYTHATDRTPRSYEEKSMLMRAINIADWFRERPLRMLAWGRTYEEDTGGFWSDVCFVWDEGADGSLMVRGMSMTEARRKEPESMILRVDLGMSARIELG